MKNIIRTIVFIILTGCFSTSCDSYIDVVPDNIATIDNAFTDRNQAEKFLYTCYSYLPRIGYVSTDGRYDDLTWTGRTAIYGGIIPYQYWILRDGNRASDPYLDNWNGANGGTALFQAIRNCNILLEKINAVRDLDPIEKIRWIAETKFLKAYYHFLLVQQYGPIPIIDVNLPVTASNEDVMVERMPVNEVFDYIIALLDEAMPDLPLKIDNVAIEMGRATQAAALAVKAKAAVTAASPLFNGNATYVSFKDSKGRPMFGVYDQGKWERAVAACKQAIDTCHHAGHGLYEYINSDLSNETRKIVQVSRIFNDRWNKEHVWAMSWMTSGNGFIEEVTIPPMHANHAAFSRGVINPTMKAAEMFYSKNGVPIDEDRFYDYENRYSIVLTSATDSKFAQTGVQTAQLHLNREYRFYGSIAFDGGLWYGLGNRSENGQWAVNTKNGDISGQRGMERFSCSGFYIKKLSNIESSYNNQTFVHVRQDYPMIRLADLYLLYAEALNESLTAPNDEVWTYVNYVRERAGLESVQDSWTNYAKNPDKYTTQSGMRDIIRRERSIELMFEGHRLNDVRRWDRAPMELTGSVRGWNYMESTPEDFYQIVTVNDVLFTDRDALSPIRTSELTKNYNLVQNPGW